MLSSSPLPSPSIVYSLVARGKTILCDSTTVSGNFELVARLLLSKLEEQQQELAGKSMLKFENDSQYSFFVSKSSPSSSSSSSTTATNNNNNNSNNNNNNTNSLPSQPELVCLCLCSVATPSRIAFSFLAEIREKFKTSFKLTDYQDAIAYSFNAEFSGVLANSMAKFNAQIGIGATTTNTTTTAANPLQDDRVRRVNEQLDDLKDVMIQNIDQLLNRGEQLDLLVERTDRMQQMAFKFKNDSEKIKNQLWWKLVKCRVGTCLFITFILFLIISVACGGLDFDRCGGG
jgi:vesicle-associated membrane protein 7